MCCTTFRPGREADAGVSEAINEVGGSNGAAELGGGPSGGRQIGAKSWNFQTELGLIPVTRCDQCYVFPPCIALSNNRHNTFSRVKNTKPSGPRPLNFLLGGQMMLPPPLTLGGHGPHCPPVPTPLIEMCFADEHMTSTRDLEIINGPHRTFLIQP